MAKTFKGIDVSQYQQNIDFKKVKAAGIDYVIIRAGFGKYAIRKTHISRAITRQLRRQG